MTVERGPGVPTSPIPLSGDPADLFPYPEKRRYRNRYT